MRSDNPGFVPDSPFSKQLPEEWLNFFKTFPKLELQCHLLGTTSKETFEELVAESGADVSQEEINNFYTRGDKPVGVLRIFRCLESKVLSKPSFLTRITLKHIQRVASQGVKYIEFYWNWTGLKHFMTYDEARQAINEGIRQGMQRYGVTARSIPSIDREDTPEAAVELVEEMTKHPDDYTIGLGIDYRETNHEPENFWKAFKMAKEAGFKITIHAGEFGEHWRNVETAMKLLGADRIDHGYTIIDNPELIKEAKASDMHFAVVPTNSYYLRTLSDEEWAIKHPVRKMVELGLKVFPNSDDPTMHHISISESWLLMHNWLDFTLPQLRKMLENSIEAAWVTDEQKAIWKKEWLKEFDRLSVDLPPVN